MMADSAGVVFWLLLGTALAGALGAALTRWLSAVPAWFARVLDRPNARSLHTQPVPRTGGLAVLAGWLAGLAVIAPATARQQPVAPEFFGFLVLAVVLVGSVSWVDDWRGVAWPWRLGAHLGAALVVVAGVGLSAAQGVLPGMGGTVPTLVAAPLMFLFVAWMINLYNFMDGLDGLAAGMTLFGFGALAVLGAQGGAWLFAGIGATLAAAAFGFLVAGNWPPARIFLGDVGAATLGLLAAALSLWGARDGLFPLWAAVLAFSPFVVDATWTLIRRALRRERLWEAHRSHHYQRLALVGWPARRILPRAYALMAAAAASAVAAPRLHPTEQVLLLALWAGVYALIHLRVRLLERAGDARGM